MSSFGIRVSKSFSFSGFSGILIINFLSWVHESSTVNSAKVYILVPVPYPRELTIIGAIYTLQSVTWKHSYQTQKFLGHEVRLLPQSRLFLNFPWIIGSKHCIFFSSVYLWAGFTYLLHVFKNIFFLKISFFFLLMEQTIWCLVFVRSKLFMIITYLTNNDDAL